jgi:GNAT superfamily N-acetyltransferase
MITIVPPSQRLAAQAIEMGRAMHAESQYRDQPFDRDKVIATVARAIEDPGWLFRFAVDDDRLVGFFLGLLDTHWFNNELVAIDRALYVAPDRRGFVAGKKLIAEYLDWARAKGCRQVFLTQSTGVEPERTQRFYEHNGFRNVGTVNVVNLEG